MQPGYIEINRPFLELIDDRSDGALSGRRPLDSDTCEEVHGINQSTWKRWSSKIAENGHGEVLARPRMVLAVLEKLDIDLDDSRLPEQAQRTLQDYLQKEGKSAMPPNGEAVVAAIATDTSPNDSGHDGHVASNVEEIRSARKLVLPVAIGLACLALAAAAASIWYWPPAPRLRMESGSLADLIVDAKHQNIRKVGRDKRKYADPTEKEARRLRRAAEYLLEDRAEDAAGMAAYIDYEVIEFTDGRTQRTFHVLAERQPAARGWGTFVLDNTAERDYLIEIAHPMFDRQTAEFGMEVLLRVPVRGFLMAGSHRNADSIQASVNPDVCRNMASAFQIVHETWSTVYTRPVQVHGFVPAWLDKEIPGDTHVILSHGTEEITAEHIALDKALDQALAPRGKCYVYNKLPAGHHDNQQVNGDIEGSRFSELAAITNEQGKFTRRVHSAPFLHVELSNEIRLNSPVMREMALTGIENYLNYNY